MYSAPLARWTTPDPLADKYYSTSPYAFSGNNPVNYVDPDGRDWYSYEKYSEKDDDQETCTVVYAWTNASSQAELDASGIKGTYLGEVVVVFEGYYDERLGTDGTLTGEGAKPANVTVYGAEGKDDIQTYIGLTMSSDYDTFGAIDNGAYDVNFKSNNPNNKIPKTHQVNRGKPVDCLGGINRYYPNPEAHSQTKKDYIYVHRTNTNGFAGYNKTKGTAVSKGCLLIDADDWSRYESQINRIPYKLIVNRK